MDVKKKSKKKQTFNEAPPTRNPSTSDCAASSLQLAPLTEPEEFHVLGNLVH